MDGSSLRRKMGRPASSGEGGVGGGGGEGVVGSYSILNNFYFEALWLERQQSQ